jgi:FAD/FMN-containing dehydrogenase
MIFWVPIHKRPCADVEFLTSIGRNNAVSGLSLDVSKLAGVKVLESFTPTTSGAEAPGKKTNVIVPVPGKQAAVTFGVGMSTQRVNNAIHASKLLTMGAAHGTVSIGGGWGQTAGHGPLTAQYGLGVDQFLEFKVVSADGELKVANKVSNPDLFWALRGIYMHHRNLASRMLIKSRRRSKHIRSCCRSYCQSISRHPNLGDELVDQLNAKEP